MERIQKIKWTRPCLIFLDLYILHINEVEFLIQAHEKLKQDSVPVVLCTAAHSDHKVFIEASKLSQGVVRKPVRIDDILGLAEKYWES